MFCFWQERYSLETQFQPLLPTDQNWFQLSKLLTVARFLPPRSLPATSRVQCSETPQDAREASSSRGQPASCRTWSSTWRPSRAWTWAWGATSKEHFTASGLTNQMDLTQFNSILQIKKNKKTSKECTLSYLDLSNSLLSSHLKGVSVLGTQKELHLGAGRK